MGWQIWDLNQGVWSLSFACSDRGEVGGAYLVQLLQGPLLLLELGNGVFSEGEVPSQGADLVIQGLETQVREKQVVKTGNTLCWEEGRRRHLF